MNYDIYVKPCYFLLKYRLLKKAFSFYIFTDDSIRRNKIYKLCIKPSLQTKTKQTSERLK